MKILFSNHNQYSRDSTHESPTICVPNGTEFLSNFIDEKNSFGSENQSKKWEVLTNNTETLK